LDKLGAVVCAHSLSKGGREYEAMRDERTDNVAACVREVFAIANGDGSVSQRRKAAEQAIGWLLKGHAESTQNIARDLHDRLSDALNAEHDHDAREVVGKAIDLLRGKSASA
jgi:hypothetical protein